MNGPGDDPETHPRLGCGRTRRAPTLQSPRVVDAATDQITHGDGRDRTALPLCDRGRESLNRRTSKPAAASRSASRYEHVSLVHVRRDPMGLDDCSARPPTRDRWSAHQGDVAFVGILERGVRPPRRRRAQPRPCSACKPTCAPANSPYTSRVTATATLPTYRDHRDGVFSNGGSKPVEILDPGVVAKTCPPFFDMLETIGLRPVTGRPQARRARDADRSAGT
jgi:hypothetical protein